MLTDKTINWTSAAVAVLLTALTCATTSPAAELVINAVETGTAAVPGNKPPFGAKAKDGKGADAIQIEHNIALKTQPTHFGAVRFDIPTIPAGNAFTSAKLVLTVAAVSSRASTGFPVGVYYAKSDNWDSSLSLEKQAAITKKLYDSREASPMAVAGDRVNPAPGEKYTLYALSALEEPGEGPGKPLSLTLGNAGWVPSIRSSSTAKTQAPMRPSSSSAMVRSAEQERDGF